VNASQNLRTAFWSLTVSFGLLLLLAVLRPDSTSPDHTIDKHEASVSHFNGDTEEETVPAPLNDSRFFSASTTVDVESVAAGDSSRDPLVQLGSPLVQLGSIEEVEDKPDSVSMVSQPPATSANGELTVQLASLRTAVEQLKQSTSDRRAYELERAAHQLKETQQSKRLRELELQLQHLQSLGPAVPDEKKAAECKPAAVGRFPSVAPTKQPEAKKEKTDTATVERFSLKLRHAEITEVLEVLGEATGYNIVIGDGVSGTVPSADLRDVTIIQALPSVVHSLGFEFEHDGKFIYVMTKSEYAARKADPKKGDSPEAR
jgi:hypothetical protein